MGAKLVIDSLQGEVWWAPDYKNNRQLDPEDQWAYLIEAADTATLRRIQEQVNIGKQPDPSGMVRYHKAQDRMIERCIKGVRNAWFPDGNGGARLVEDAAESLCLAPEDITAQAVKAITDHSELTEGQVKN